MSPQTLATLERVVRGLPDAILLIDEDWRITYCNDSAKRISRIREESAVGTSLWELWPSAVGTELEKTFREVAALKEERRIPSYFYAPFETWYDIRITPLEGGLAVHYCDVTAMHEIEQERALSNTQMQQVLNATADGVALIDRQWHFAFLNNRAQEMLEMTDAELRGKDIWESFPAMVYEGSPFVQHYRAAMEKAKAGEFETYYPAPLNRWIHIFARPSRDGVIVFFRDVSEQKQAAQELRDSQERLSAIYSGTVEYIGLLAPDGTLLEANAASLGFAGNKREDLIGKKFWDCPWWIYTPGAAEQLKAWIVRAAEGDFVRHEAPLIRPNGDVMTFDFSLHPIKDEQGHVVFLVPEGRDITDLKRAEGALMQSEKLAAVGRLASSIAHEINNPLEAVTNVIYLASLHAQDDEQRNLLAMADQELKRVANITHQTLRFHKQASNPQAITCDDLFTSVLSIYGGRLRNANVNVEYRLRARQPVVCFEGDIRQVLNNLVDNALDAMPGGGRLRLRSREGTDWRSGKRGVLLTVADNGSGIDAVARKKIFEPFFTTKGIGGTGLGLWISSDIMERHGGWLRLRSSQNSLKHGTVVCVFLPFR